MTALEMLEFLASAGYKACWYAMRVGEQAVPHIRVSHKAGGPLIYHINEKEGTREQAEALLEENMTASLGGQ